MIVGFRCAETEKLNRGVRVARWIHVEATAVRKLATLNAANVLQDLRVPPGNRLEALLGNRAGQYSIRVNDQWRICFRWSRSGPFDVEIVDYHS